MYFKLQQYWPFNVIIYESVSCGVAPDMDNESVTEECENAVFINDSNVTDRETDTLAIPERVGVSLFVTIIL